MKLQSYLASRNTPARDFSRKLGVSPAAVARYASGKRIPNPEIMRRIVTETDGAVTPNDFYDVPVPATDAPGRTVVTFMVDEDLLAEAERLGTDLTAVAERALAAALNDARRARWREENAAAIAEANRELERNGLWSDGLRQF